MPWKPIHIRKHKDEIKYINTLMICNFSCTTFCEQLAIFNKPINFVWSFIQIETKGIKLSFVDKL